MVLTPSNMMQLGTKAPDFSLHDTVSGKTLSLEELKSDKATVIMFICNHCPYVLHIKDKLASVAQEYSRKGVNFIAISANDVESYPQDAPEKMTQFAKANQFNFPYLYDESQEVAKAYQAACTPDFYIFDANLACVYRGRFDASTPGNNEPLTGKDLTNALDTILSGNTISEEQFPSMGCNIKWRR